LSRVEAGKSDNLVGDYVSPLRDKIVPDDLISSVVLLACNEEYALGSPFVEEGIIGVTHIENNNGAGIGMKKPDNSDIVNFCLGDSDEDGGVGIMVETCMDFNATLGLSEFRPGKQGQTKRDGGGIEGEEFVFETEFCLSVTKPAPCLEMLICREEHTLEEFCGTLGIGVGEGGTNRGLCDSKMTKFSQTGFEAVGDVTEAVGMGELAEDHRDELSPAGETFCVPFGSMLMNKPVELETREMKKKLTKKTGYLYHDDALPLCKHVDILVNKYCHTKDRASLFKRYFGQEWYVT